MTPPRPLACPRPARAGALAALLAAGVALSGCGLHLLPHRGGAPAPPAAAAAVQEAPRAPRDPLAEARARAAAEPAEPYWPYRAGQLLVAADSLRPAQIELRTALARDPGYAPALSLLSKLDFDSGRHAEAVALLEPVLRAPERYSAAERAGLLAGLAMHYDALGRTDLAAATLATLTRREQERAGAAAVYVELRGEHPDSAADLARAALDDDQKSAVNQNNYGIARLRAGDPKAARTAFLAAIDRDPELPGPYYNLAILEKYYRFDDAAAGRWFSAYWKRSQEDPDSLGRVLGGKPLAQGGNQP
jgi:tetratricopeptide (TPR) repeat protein